MDYWSEEENLIDQVIKSAGKKFISSDSQDSVNVVYNKSRFSSLTHDFLIWFIQEG